VSLPSPTRAWQASRPRRHLAERGFAYEGVGDICSEKDPPYGRIDISEGFRRCMDDIQTAQIVDSLHRITEALERLLKFIEMRP